jgi:hypothetical protein
MQALAADFSGYAEDSAAVFRDKSSNRLSGFQLFNNRSESDAQRLFKSFLARNELVAPRFG